MLNHYVVYLELILYASYTLEKTQNTKPPKTKSFADLWVAFVILRQGQWSSAEVPSGGTERA